MPDRDPRLAALDTVSDWVEERRKGYMNTLYTAEGLDLAVEARASECGFHSALITGITGDIFGQGARDTSTVAETLTRVSDVIATRRQGYAERVAKGGGREVQAYEARLSECDALLAMLAGMRSDLTAETPGMRR